MWYLPNNKITLIRSETEISKLSKKKQRWLNSKCTMSLILWNLALCVSPKRETKETKWKKMNDSEVSSSILQNEHFHLTSNLNLLFKEFSYRLNPIHDFKMCCFFYLRQNRQFNVFIRLNCAKVELRGNDHVGMWEMIIFQKSSICLWNLDSLTGILFMLKPGFNPVHSKCSHHGFKFRSFNAPLS